MNGPNFTLHRDMAPRISPMYPEVVDDLSWRICRMVAPLNQNREKTRLLSLRNSAVLNKSVTCVFQEVKRENLIPANVVVEYSKPPKNDNHWSLIKSARKSETIAVFDNSSIQKLPILGFESKSTQSIVSQFDISLVFTSSLMAY